MSTRKKKLIGSGIAAFLLVGMVFLYQSYAASWQMDKVRQLAAEARDLPKDQAKEARSKVWAEAKKLSPEQRRELFAEEGRSRMKAYFSLSREKKNEMLDAMIKRDLQRQAERKKQQAAAARSKTGAAKGNSATAKAGGAQGKGQGGPGGGGGGRQNMSPEQRAAARRDRLDKSNPSDRAMRGEMAADMRARRQQLGLPAGGGRGGFR